MAHAKLDLTNKILALQFQISWVMDETYAIRSMVMEIKLNFECQA